MHQRPTAEGHVGRVAIGSVLVLGVLDGLARERVLQLGRRNRDAVDEQAQVEGLGGSRVVWELARDREAVGEVSLGQLGRQAVGRLEEGQADLDAVVIDAVAQDIDRAALVDLLRESIGKLLVCSALPRRGRRRVAPMPWGCVSAMKANSSAVSSPRARSKSADHSGLVPHLQTRYPPASTRLAVIASSNPRSSTQSCSHPRDLDLAGNGRGDERLASL